MTGDGRACGGWTTTGDGRARGGFARRVWGRRATGRSWVVRCLALFLCLVPAAMQAAEMEGPLGGKRRPGEAPAADFRLDRIRFESDGEWLRMTIPIKAPWAHWTLTDPPRIIVDLGQTTSHLPKAPGLYQARLDRGPVRALRTSQFLYSPLDHRVRITLELSEVVPYQARRVGDEIQILIPDRVVRTPRTMVVGPAGIAAIDDGSSRAAELPSPEVAGFPAGTERPTLAAGSSAETIATTPVPQVRPASPRPDAVPDDGAPAGDVVSGAAVAGSPESLGSGSGPDAASRPPAKTLSDALAEFGGISIEAAGEDDFAPPTKPLPQGSPPKGTVPRPTRPEAPRARAAFAAAAAPVRSVSSTSFPPALVREAPPAKAPDDADAAGAPGVAPAPDPKERSAARLLRQSVLATLRGDLKTAAATADRAHGFYAGTATGDQCGILAQEIYRLLGKPADANRITGLPALPDTTRLPRALYLSFVDQYRRSGDLAAVGRLLRQWGPVYGPLPGLAALQYSIGEAFLRAGDDASAEDYLRQVPAGDSLEAPALLLIASMQDRRGEREPALETYRKVGALASGPYRARGMARSADIEFRLGRVRESLASYERLLQSNPPRDEEAWGIYQAGNCRLLLGESGLAKERYETLVKLWPKCFWAPFARERLEEMTWKAQLTGGNAGR